MSISTIASTTTAIPSQPSGHHHHGGGMRKAEAAAAQALGLSADDLTAALQQGQTITQLAQSKGVSLDSVTTAVSTALGQADPSLSTQAASQIAQRFVQGPSGARPSGPPPQLKDAFDAAAKTLGLSSDELQSQLRDGQSLASIAKGKDVDVSTVAAAMATALQSDDSSLSAGDAATEAQQLMDGPPTHQAGVLTQALGTLASDLGIDGSTLGNDIMSGQSLSSVASSAGVSQDTLLKDFADALQKADPGLSSDDAASVAQQLVDVTVSSARAAGTYTTTSGGSDPSVSSLA
jgi:uncharacterized protein YidB (DUF937 family)